MDRKLPTYYVSFTDDNEAIEFISLVEQPAIEVNWLAFSKTLQPFGFKQVGDQQKLAGPFAIPDLPIYRFDEELGEYNIIFTKETIQKMADKFNSQSLSQNINLDHQPDSKVPGAFISENWITDTVDKSQKYGFSLPEGTWFGVVSIQNTEFWTNYVKEKKVLGFSIEGMLGVTTKKMNTMNTEKLIFAEAKTKDGVVLTAESFEVGKEITVDGAPAPDASYEMEDGSTIVVKGGLIEAVTPAVDAPAQPVDAVPEAMAAPEVPAPADTTPVPAVDAMVKEMQGMMAVLEERVAALEEKLTSTADANTELMSKVEMLSKLPGSTSVVKDAKLAKAKSLTEPKAKQTFKEQVDRLKNFSLGQK